mgnify:CR=1 FL=1
MNKILDRLKEGDYQPRSNAQEYMMACDLANIDEVVMGGAGGAGKTIALIISSLGPQNDGSLLTDKSSYTGLIFRREASQLEKSGLIRTATEWYKKFYPEVEYNGSLKRFLFPSGASITFAGCEMEEDAFKYKGYSKLHFIGFEELTQFSQMQYEILSSRLRDAEKEIPLRVRATTNPGDKHETWVLNRFKYWLIDSCILPLETDIRQSSGKPLYRSVNIDDPDLKVIVSRTKPKGNYQKFCFIETHANDILSNNVQEMAMKLSDPVLRAQLVGGKWGLKLGGGMYFSEEDIKEYVDRPSQVSGVRYWDRAIGNDYLAGVKLLRDRFNKFYVEDYVLQKVKPDQIQNIIINTAKKDGQSITVAIEQEGASAGKEISYIYEQKLRGEGFKVIIDIKRASKLERAQMISGPMREGRIGFRANLDLREPINQLVNFPNGEHDDFVDALSGAYFIVTNKIPAPMIIEQGLQSAMAVNRMILERNPFEGGTGNYC